MTLLATGNIVLKIAEKSYQDIYFIVPIGYK